MHSLILVLCYGVQLCQIKWGKNVLLPAISAFKDLTVSEDQAQKFIDKVIR